MMKIVKSVRTFTASQMWLVMGLALLFASSQHAEALFAMFERGPEPHTVTGLFILSLIILLGSVAHYTTLPSQIPSFVGAIAFGIAGKPFLAPLISEEHFMSVLVTGIVACILFSGGLETRWEDFKKLLPKITVLSFLGLFVTALVFSTFVWEIGTILGYSLSLTSAVLLGAVLASTDPAAIIPAFEVLKLKNPRLKDIAIAESALTDVTGTLLTFTFVTMLSAGVGFSSIFSAYGMVFTTTTAKFLGTQLLWGCLLGIAGYLSIEFLHKRKQGERNGLIIRLRQLFGRPPMNQPCGKRPEYAADAALFLAAVGFACVFAITLEGSGYLAVFITGLLLGTIEEHLGKTEKTFYTILEAFFKPAIFILLGAMVDIPAMLAYAPIGIVAALVFMFVIRPLAVFLSLSPWLGFSKGKMTVRELLFLSFVRETGAIPAGLIITLVGKGLGDTALLSIGMWVILATLVILPPFTPAVARRLGVAF